MSTTLILGAGELGAAVISAFTKHQDRAQVKLTVATRKGNDVETSRHGGIQQVKCDVSATTTSDLAELFSRYDTIVSCTGMSAPAGTQSKICKAILQAGVRRYFPWQFGLDYDVVGRGSSQDLFNEQLDVRSLLRGQSQTEWAIVSVGLFTDFLFDPTFGIVTLDAAGTPIITGLGSWQNRLTVTSPVDIGRAVAELTLRDWTEARNGVTYLAGSTLTFDDVGSIVDRVSGKASSRTLRTSKDIADALEGDPSNGILKYQAVWAAGVGVAWDENATWNAKKGMRFERAEEYLQMHADKVFAL